MRLFRLSCHKGGRPKKNDEKKPAENRQELPPRDQIANLLNETKDFITLANIFNGLPEDIQEGIKQWALSEKAGNGPKLGVSNYQVYRENAGKGSF